ncbi:MAG: hypothetical protein H6861_01465 [Rhodospirillales bacterium]|nr:hypothetical protein [Rhodospirillales bacterium]
MIEAVNSVISNARLARFTADQVATLNSFAADAEAVQSVARGPVAPYVSPYISVDTRFDTAVLQIRDSDTGDILTQFPSETTLEQRRVQAARAEAARAETARATTEPVNTPSQNASNLDVSEAAFQAQQVAQTTPTQSVGGAPQAAIAALSAGAQSGASSTGTVNVTA